MRAALRVSGLVAAALLATGAAPARAADSGLDAYDVRATKENIRELRKQGYDVLEGRTGDRQEIVATAGQAAKLARLGVRAALKRDAAGRTERQRAQRGVRPDGSYDVFRPYSDPTYVGRNADGTRRQTILEELTAFAAANPKLVRSQIIGRSVNGTPIMAYRVTKNARTEKRKARPSVLYMATQHAREWIVPENLRRQFRYVVERYGKDPRITRLVNTRELWFVPVANPDGYDFTFTKGNRLWRKNLREINGITGTQSGDGVDPNRNFPKSWGQDDEGSSPDPASETYRGPGPASEPETQAIDGLFRQQGFTFLVNYHSAAELLLYGNGNYVETTTPDDPIYRALSGTDADPAIKGKAPEVPNAYDPDDAAELYTTNGETTEYTYSEYNALSWTPEMDVADATRGAVGEDAGPPSVFEFQDSEGDLQAAFLKNLPFALDVADSADDPAEPESYLGNTVKDFELKPFTVSYGSPQTVAVLAKRKLGAVRILWSINGGPERSATTAEFQGGERFGGGGAHFHEVRGVVAGAKPGDTVRVRFEAAGRRSSPSFSYAQASDSDAPVLLLAAENQKGPSAYPPLPATAGALAFDRPYAEALRAAGVAFDTWDVDARGAAPDPLGVLSHYRAVVWYTGNDLLPRIPGQPGGTGAAKFGNDTILAARSFMNEGGKLLYTGQNAAFSTGFPYNPKGEPPFCDASASSTGPFNQCVLISDDFLQYWVGAFLPSDVAGAIGGDVATNKAAVSAVGLKLDPAFGGTPFGLNGGDSADNQAHLTATVSSESVLGSRYPSKAFATFDRPSAFSPSAGTGYAVARSDDSGWQRLRKTVDLRGKTTADLKFKLSYDTELDYDYVFVEAHTVGNDDWTTLPDVNGNTAKAPGESCLNPWRALHPFVDAYQTYSPGPPATCTADGLTGEFNAATGNSGGYQDWNVDLSRYAGKEVELSITYAQDQAVAGLGVFLDEVQVTKNGTVTEEVGFEGGSLGGFVAGPPPAGSEVGTQKAWTSTADIGLVVAPGIATPDSVYLSFGFEGITSGPQRRAVMDAALTHLGVLGAASRGR